MATRKNTFLLKRSNVAGNIPTAGQIQLGELALNTADVKLYASGTTTNSILPIGWDRISRTGDTMSGTLYVPTISATTYQNLPLDIRVTGGTYSTGTATFTNNTGGTFTVTGLATQFTGGTVAGPTIFTGGVTANTISATTYQNLPNDLPTAGTTGQILAKNSNTNYDVTWIDNYADWTSQLKHIVKAGEAINKGQAVYVSSANGTNIIVSKASNTTEATSSKTLGLLAQDLALNGQGFVIAEGLLSGLNTGTATAGDPVWLGTNGNLIFGLLNKPVAPAHLVYLGVVTRVQTVNGEIFVRPQNGFEFNELHDVLLTGVTNGDLVSYNSATSLWKNTKTLDGSYNVTGTLSATTITATSITAGSFTGNLTGLASLATSATTALNATRVSLTDDTSTNGNFSVVWSDSTNVSSRLFTDISNFTFNPSTNTLTTTNFAGTATNATNVGVTNNTSTNATYYLGFVSATSGNLPLQVDSNTLTFNPSTNILTLPNIVATGTITATTISATTYQNLPTDIRVTGGTYSTGTATFRNNTGGTFTVTGFNTGTITGSGTDNFVPRFNGTSALENSIIYDNGTSVGINTTTPSYNLDINGNLGANRFYQKADGVPTNNLGDPTITEMALFDSQFDNKTAFYPLIYGSPTLIFETYNGATWTDISSTISDTDKRRLFGGDNTSNIVIPNGVVQYQITISAATYVYLNALYDYWSSNGHSSQVQIWKKHNSGSWVQHTFSTATVSSWPGHLYLPFTTIPWHPVGSLGTHYNQVRIVYTPTWNVSFPSNNINLYKLQLWGGYPAGKRVVYSTDELRNVTFPSNLTSTTLISTQSTGTSPLTVNSTTLVTNLNADYLDGQHGSFYYPASNPNGYTTNTGTVTAVNGGNGMNFTNFTTSGTITMGTPSSTTLASTNATTTNSHTHAFAPGGTAAQYITGAGTLVTFPTITTVNDGALTLATSGIATGSASFTANQAGASTFTVNVPATDLSIGSNTGTVVRVDSSTGTDATLPVATASLAGVVTNTTQSFAGVKTFNDNVNMANTADLKFVDLAGTFPTSGKGFDWELNNDGARIYAIQPSSDSIDLVFQLRDNATTNDRFVFHVDDYQGPAFDKYPLIIRGGTEFDLVSSALYTNGTVRLSNAGVLQNVTGNISMFTNDSGYLLSSRTLSINGTTYDLTANRSWVVPTVTANTINNSTYDLTISTSNGVNYTTNLGILATDVKVTGGTYNPTTGVVTFTNTTGGTFNVTGFSTGMTDTFVTGGTYSTGTATFTRSNGATFNVTGFNTGTVTAVNGGNGMNFTNFTTSGTITLGTPSSTTLASTNALTTNSHTHAFAPGGTAAQYITGAGTLVTFPTITNGTVTSVAALTLGTTGTDLNSTVANPTTTPVITLNVPNASATARGVITTGAQTIAGAKTFTSTLAGTNATLSQSSAVDTLNAYNGGTNGTAISGGAGDGIGAYFVNNSTTNPVVRLLGLSNTRLLEGRNNSDIATFSVTSAGIVSGSSFVRIGGTSAQFLKADGTVDSSTYVPTSRTITINGLSQDLSANRTWTVTGSAFTGGTVTGATNFTAGLTANTISATTVIANNFTGLASLATSATTALNATNVGVTNNTTTNATYYPTFVDGTSGNKPLQVDSSTLTFNPSTNTLTVANLAGTATSAVNATNASYIGVTDDATTNSNFYVTFANQTNTNSRLWTDSARFYFNPSTNTLTVDNLNGLASLATSATTALNATNATNATKIFTSNLPTTDVLSYPTFVTGYGGNRDLYVDSNTLTYNPSSNILTLVNVVATGTITATTISATTYQNLPNAGTVTAVNSGNGMNFTNFTTSGTITLGTPSSTTLASTNALTTNSHTHAFAPGGTAAQYITGAGTLVTFPTIPTVNDGTLTLATSGIATGSASFTANQAGTSTFTVNVPATDLSIGVSSGTQVRMDSSTGADVDIPVASATLAGIVTTGAQTFAGTKTFNSTISGNITGNAGTASVATRVNMIDDASTNSDFPIVWADSTNTSARLYTDNARFTYNPASDLLRASRGVFSTSVDTNTLTANVLMTGPSVSATTVKGITISATTYLNLPSGGGGISGGGTVNFLPKFTGSTAVGNSLIYDNGTSVGIGMTTPSATAKLDVAGIIRSVLPDPTGIGGITAKLLSYVSSPYGLIFSGHVSGVHSIQNQREANAAQLYPLVFQPLGGNVGVGTLTPAKLLDVNGDALINGLTVGKGSTGVYNNVALGDQALASNTTGYNNVAIHSSLVTNTTGEFNVGIGYKSLFINTIGQRNIAVGNGALQLNIDGNYNTAIGNNVLYTNSNGSGNVAIGDNSLYLNTGGYNTAIGNDTLANNIGDVNLALGVGAGATLLNGSKNNIIGVNNTTLPDGNDLTYENYTLSISKENSNYKGLPQIWSPEQVIVYASTGVDIMVIEGEAYSSVFIDYVLEDDSGNMRAGVLKCVFNNGLGTIKWDENPTSDIGSTINYTFSFNNNGGNLLGVRLLNSGGNDVICNFTSRILLRAIF